MKRDKMSEELKLLAIEMIRKDRIGVAGDILLVIPAVKEALGYLAEAKEQE